MLTRIDHLKNVGRFTSFKQRADALGPLALLFARNGFGKTTLCAVLRSAAAQSSGPIDERQHLGNAEPPEASLTFDPTGAVVFQNGTWNRRPPSILTFDSEFVRRNVHTADEVTRDNKRQLLRVIVGAAGVRLAEAVTDIDVKNTKLNTELKGVERAIQAAHPSITDYPAFAFAEVPSDIQARIDEHRRRLVAAERASEIRSRQNLGIWQQLPDLDRVIASLADVLDGTSELAERRIVEHMTKHGFDEKGRRWLVYGTDRAKDTCPYCDQDLAGSAIAADFKVMFGAAFTALLGTLDVQLSLFKVLLSAGQTGSFREVVKLNRSSIEFWSQVGELPPLDDLGETDLVSIGEALGPIVAALEMKVAAPLQPVALDANQARSARQAINRLEEYARQVLAFNQAIEVVREENAGQLMPAQMRELQQAVDKRVALQAKAQEPLKTLCDDWTSKTRERETLTNDRSNAQKALTAHVETTATAYEAGINELLEAFGANFRLCQTKTSYVGRDPNTEYCIDVNGHVLKAGETGTALKPSFRTVLSAGDKSSLALALFITQVRQRADLGDCIVVFDDPFNSQDAARQFETASQIRSIAADARQVIVLSHDPRFLHLIEKDKGSLAVTQHQIVAESDWIANLKAWNVEEEVKADYVRRAERIRAYASTGQHLTDCSSALLASDIRIFVEEYIDLRFPGRFAARTLLGAMVDEIDEAGSDDHLYAHRADLRSLNEFSRPDHHRGTSPPDPIQLRAQCKKVIKIVGAY